MRTPKRLSLSALSVAEKNREEFFLRYIVPKELRPPRDPQTGPMSVGSAFDAIVKSAINRDLYICDDNFLMRVLVVQQCEEATLPESLVIAAQLWEQYVECGAYHNLLRLIDRNSCKMEYDLTAVIDGIPLLGKPDLHFLSGWGAHVITDWKVSGSCSTSGVSPQQGYMVALDTHDSRTNGKAHKKFVPVEHRGGLVVSALPMNQTTDYWADQLSTYAWCLGEPVGSQDFIVRIEQLAVRPGLRTKCCVHQSTVEAEYQHELIERYKKVWSDCQSGHIFSDLPRDASDEKCNALIRQLMTPAPGTVKPSCPSSDEIGDWF